MLTTKMDSICDGLHKIFPDKSAAEFKARLKKGRKKKSSYWLLYPKRVSYIQYKECKKLPLFRETPGKGGFYTETTKERSLTVHWLPELWVICMPARTQRSMVWSCLTTLSLEGKVVCLTAQKSETNGSAW